MKHLRRYRWLIPGALYYLANIAYFNLYGAPDNFGAIVLIETVGALVAVVCGSLVNIWLGKKTY